MEPDLTPFDRFIINLPSIGLMSSFAFVFGFIRIMFTVEKMPLSYHMTTLLSSVVVGTVIGQIASETGFTDWAAFGICSASAALSRDIIGGILNKKFLAELAKRAAENIVDKTTR